MLLSEANRTGSSALQLLASTAQCLRPTVVQEAAARRVRLMGMRQDAGRYAIVAVHRVAGRL